MRIKDLTEENVLDEGPVWDKVKGFFKGKPKTAPTASSSPFDIIPPREAKAILAAVINGQALDANQLMQIKKVYSRL